MATLEELRQRISPEVKEQVPLAPFTTFRIGGPAEFYFEAESADDVVQAVRAAKDLDVPYHVLGGGSNVLISDDGVPGLVIRMTGSGLVIEGEEAVALAGTASGQIAAKTAAAGLAGFEWAIGLPGTIGGAVWGNAGMFGGETKDVVASVLAWVDGKPRELSNEECGFGYRSSAFKEMPGAVILSVRLRLEREDPLVLQTKMREFLAKKREHQPIELYSAGCVFRNWMPPKPEDSEVFYRAFDLDKDERIPFNPDGSVPAGWMIDRAQLKGKKVGQCRVSERHGNYIVHEGGGTASEVIALTSFLKMKIRDMTRGTVFLMDEIEYIGF